MADTFNLLHPGPMNKLISVQYNWECGLHANEDRSRCNTRMQYYELANIIPGCNMCHRRLICSRVRMKNHLVENVDNKIIWRTRSGSSPCNTLMDTESNTLATLTALAADPNQIQRIRSSPTMWLLDSDLSSPVVSSSSLQISVRTCLVVDGCRND